jgi:peptidoglycan/xylan/chitin deacetylase (PgdA/CDA1 family)
MPPLVPCLGEAAVVASRTVAALAVLPLLLAGPAAAADEPRPKPTNGPWPPARVLAAEPRAVPAALAAVVNAACPAPAAGVQHYAPGAGKTVALTFDDGPGPGTQEILAILQRYGVTATFFDIGTNESRRPREVRSIAATGAALGNHTWSHPQLPTLDSAGQAGELDSTSAQQARLVGAAPCLFRPPYGEYDSTTVSLSRARRMTVWNWSVDTEDWKAGTSTDPSWVERITTRAQAGSSQDHPVILLHNPPSGIPATVLALPAIIEHYQARGYRFVDLLGRDSQRNAPAAAATGGALHVAERAADGSLRVRSLAGGAWSGWTSLGGVLVGGPAAAAVTSDTTAFVRLGTENAVWLRTRTDAGAATAWISLGGTGTSKPGIARHRGRHSVVVRGADGAAWLRESNGGTWGEWRSLGGRLGGAPVVTTTAGGGLNVAVRGTDGALHVRHRGTAWGAWRKVGGNLTAEPALSTTAGGDRLVAMVRGPDGQAWVTVGNATGSSWSAFTPVGGRLTSGPGLAVAGGVIEAFVYGPDGRIWQNTARAGATAGDWSGWRALP